MFCSVNAAVRLAVVTTPSDHRHLLASVKLAPFTSTKDALVPAIISVMNETALQPEANVSPPLNFVPVAVSVFKVGLPLATPLSVVAPVTVTRSTSNVAGVTKAVLGMWLVLTVSCRLC